MFYFLFQQRPFSPIHIEIKLTFCKIFLCFIFCKVLSNYTHLLMIQAYTNCTILILSYSIMAHKVEANIMLFWFGQIVFLFCFCSLALKLFNLNSLHSQKKSIKFQDIILFLKKYKNETCFVLCNFSYSFTYRNCSWTIIQPSKMLLENNQHYRIQDMPNIPKTIKSISENWLN